MKYRIIDYMPKTCNWYEHSYLMRNILIENMGCIANIDKAVTIYKDEESKLEAKLKDLGYKFEKIGESVERPKEKKGRK